MTYRRLSVRFNGRWFRPTVLHREIVHEERGAPGYGRTFWMVSGPSGTVQYVELVLPEDQALRDLLVGSYPDGRMSDSSWHQPTPIYDEQDPTPGCHLYSTCYMTSSWMDTRRCRETLDGGGVDALWVLLEELYDEYATGDRLT